MLDSLVFDVCRFYDPDGLFSAFASQPVTVQNTGRVTPGVKVQVCVSVRRVGRESAVRPRKVSSKSNVTFLNLRDKVFRV